MYDTCYQWIHLFELTGSYDCVYKWFEYLDKMNKADVVSYVIMPNHLHVILKLRHSRVDLNKIISNGKRFIAYEIISRLKDKNRHDILDQLHNAITVRQSKKGQIHRVFEESFDAKAIYSDAFLFQKLDYIHHNPVRGKWNLVDDFAEYEHSSAGYYELGKSIVYMPKHYKEL